MYIREMVSCQSNGYSLVVEGVYEVVVITRIDGTYNAKM